MTVDDAPEFANLLDLLAEALDAPASELRKLAYFDALQDLSLVDVADAVRRLMKTARFFPKPVDIREAILGDVAGVIESEWLAMRTAMHVVGAYRTLICQNPALGQTIQAVFGSWPEACSADFSPEMWSSKRKEFDRVYRVFAERAREVIQPIVLKGIAQGHNDQQSAWTRFTAYGWLAGRTARVLTVAEAQPYLGGAKLLEASTEAYRELTPEESAAALQSAFEKTLKTKEMS